MPRHPQAPAYPTKPHQSGQARIRLAGRDVYLGVWGSPESHAEYARRIALWQTEGSAAADQKPATVEDALALWQVHAEQERRLPDGTPKKELIQFAYALRPLRRLWGHVPVREFGPKALKAYQVALATGSWRTAAEAAAHARTGKPLGCCQRVVDRHTTRVKTVFRWLESEELVPASTLHALETVGGVPDGVAVDWGDVPPVSEADLAKTLPHLGPVVRALVEFQLLTAARPGEVVGLRPCDFDTSGRLEVARNVVVELGPAVWAVRLDKNKTAHRKGRGGRRAEVRRIILVGPRAQAVLAPYLAGRGPETCLFSPREAAAAFLEGKGRRVRHGRNRQPGEHYSVDSYRRAVQKACARAGVEPWSPHQLRHLAATNLVEQFGWEVAKTLLGHKSLDSTKIYALDAYRKAGEAASRAG